MHKIKYAFKDIGKEGNKKNVNAMVFKDQKTFKIMNDHKVETGTLPMLMLKVHTIQLIGTAI